MLVSYMMPFIGIVLGLVGEQRVEMRDLSRTHIAFHRETSLSTYWEFFREDSGVIANRYSHGDPEPENTIQFSSDESSEYYSSVAAQSFQGELIRVVAIAHANEVNLSDYPTSWGENWLEVYSRDFGGSWERSRVATPGTPEDIWICPSASGQMEILIQMSSGQSSLWRYTRGAKLQEWDKTRLMQLEEDDKICVDNASGKTLVWLCREEAGGPSVHVYVLDKSLSKLAGLGLSENQKFQKLSPFAGRKEASCIVSTWNGDISVWQVFEIDEESMEICRKLTVEQQGPFIGNSVVYDRKADAIWFLSLGNKRETYLCRTDPRWSEFSKQLVSPTGQSIPSFLMAPMDGSVVLGRAPGRK